MLSVSSVVNLFLMERLRECSQMTTAHPPNGSKLPEAKTLLTFQFVFLSVFVCTCIYICICICHPTFTFQFEFPCCRFKFFQLLAGFEVLWQCVHNVGGCLTGLGFSLFQISRLPLPWQTSSHFLLLPFCHGHHHLKPQIMTEAVISNQR